MPAQPGAKRRRVWRRLRSTAGSHVRRWASQPLWARAILQPRLADGLDDGSAHTRGRFSGPRIGETIGWGAGSLASPAATSRRGCSFAAHRRSSWAAVQPGWLGRRRRLPFGRRRCGHGYRRLRRLTANPLAPDRAAADGRRHRLPLVCSLGFAFSGNGGEATTYWIGRALTRSRRPTPVRPARGLRIDGVHGTRRLTACDHVPCRA
jgi:hypothetical protein